MLSFSLGIFTTVLFLAFILFVFAICALPKKKRIRTQRGRAWHLFVGSRPPLPPSPFKQRMEPAQNKTSFCCKPTQQTKQMGANKNIVESTTRLKTNRPKRQGSAVDIAKLRTFITRHRSQVRCYPLGWGYLHNESHLSVTIQTVFKLCDCFSRNFQTCVLFFDVKLNFVKPCCRNSSC